MGECEEAYGFLPCSTSLGGSISLMVIYGYILLCGANSLSNGSELLLEILDPGLIGGLVLPVLGALPDALIILVSGLGGSREEAKEQVAVGVGTLAGSTIMLLTIATGGSILLGRCDIVNGKAVDRTLTKRSWTETGISTDRASMLNAAIMVASCLLYASVQVPTFMGLSYDPPAALAGAIVCFVMLAVYCVYQVLWPELQRRKMERAHKKRLRQMRAIHALERLHGKGGPFKSLFDSQGRFDPGVVNKLFDSFDLNKDGHIDVDEMRAFVIGLAIPSEDNPEAIDEDVGYWMKEFDQSADGKICKEEFASELERWLRIKMAKDRGESEVAEVVISTEHGPENEVQLLDVKPEEEDEEEEEEKVALTHGQIVRQATLLLALGTAVCAVFSDPMVDAVGAFSKASEIPAFFVGFVVTPFASNSSELVSSLQFAAKKRCKNISLTFSQVYGAVTMNATMCLGLFLFVIWYQDLAWTYTSEVAVIVGTTVVVGAAGMTRTTWPTWTAAVLLAIYPLSIVLVYVFDYVLKWDG